MTPLVKILIVLAISIAIMVYVIVGTKRLSLPDSTKTALYILAVLMPIIGLILFELLSRKLLNNS